MIRISLLTVLLTLFILSSNSQNINSDMEKINADSAINNIERYSKRNIEIEGRIIHVCGVDGRKMKLRTMNGEIIKIVPSDSTLRFDKTYNGKTVIVQGKMTEYRLEKLLVDSLEKEKTLLCHIDNSPCKDKEWVEYQINKGLADSLSKKDIEELRATMFQTGNDFVTVFTMIAEKIIIKEESVAGR